MQNDTTPPLPGAEYMSKWRNRQRIRKHSGRLVVRVHSYSPLCFCRAPLLLGHLPPVMADLPALPGVQKPVGSTGPQTDKILTYLSVGRLYPVSIRNSWVLASQTCKLAGQRRSDSALFRQSPQGDPLFLANGLCRLCSAMLPVGVARFCGKADGYKGGSGRRVYTRLYGLDIDIHTKERCLYG